MRAARLLQPRPYPRRNPSCTWRPPRGRLDATDLIKGLRRALKRHAKTLKSDIEPLLKKIEDDLQAVLNIESHAGRGRSSGNEVASAIGRIEELRSNWTCANCQTSIWFVGNPSAGRCKCGNSHFPPPDDA